MEVQVKHLIETLQKFNPELPVILDKDGWMETELNPENELDLIKKRGLWYARNYGLIINN